MKILIVLSVFILMSVWEAVKLIREKYWKELIFYGFFLTVGLIWSILMVAGVKLPYVTTAIGKFIKAVFKL